MELWSEVAALTLVESCGEATAVSNLGYQREMQLVAAILLVPTLPDSEEATFWHWCQSHAEWLASVPPLAQAVSVQTCAITPLGFSEGY